jgi:hypothetical protein
MNLEVQVVHFLLRVQQIRQVQLVQLILVNQAFQQDQEFPTYLLLQCLLHCLEHQLLLKHLLLPEGLVNLRLQDFQVLH